jgi:hypothetical protein
MMGEKYDPDIAEIDAFLADPKTLDGAEPLWRSASRPDELQATWGIVESSGISRAELRFRCPTLNRAEPSISLIFRRKAVWRVDLVASHSWKPNPIGADKLGLPPLVYGAHAHTWQDNREYIRRNGFGPIPYRRPLPISIKRLPQALAAFADEINLTLANDQRGFDVPPRKGLFD